MKTEKILLAGATGYLGQSALTTICNHLISRLQFGIL